MNTSVNENEIPLVVDLDGTFIKTDLLHEAIVAGLKKNILNIFMFIIWFFKGKVHFKNEISKHYELKPELLPYNSEIIDFLKTEFDKGRKIILATASLKSQADQIAKIHPFFHEVFGTEKEENLKGDNKRIRLEKHYGKMRFDYIGNSTSDLPIFESCRYSYLVNPSNNLVKKTKKVSSLKHIWISKNETIKKIIDAIRVYQWVKNLLIFVPLITSHSFNSKNLIYNDIVAFFAFSLVASGGYIFNDLIDLNSDRSHPRKKNRPFASGNISIASGIVLILVLLSSGLILALRLNPDFVIILLFYLASSFTYSAYLKKIVLYDVFILALLYSVRIFAGGLVIDVSISFWLIAFSTFIFLSLAIIKRYSELIQIHKETNLESRGRQYSIEDLSLLQIMGITSGFLSIVVFSMYINSAEVVSLYTKPRFLWIISLLFLFWISRIWLVATRKHLTDDPIVFALKDRTSHIIFLLIISIILISI